MRAKSLLPWFICALCFISTVAGGVLWLRSGEKYTAEALFNFLIPFSLLAFPTVGALVLSRRSDNVIGWLFLAFGVTSGIGPTADAYASLQPALPGAHAAALFGVATIDSPAVMSFFVFFLLLFPEGRLPSRRWRLFARYCVIVTVLVEVYALFVQQVLELNDGRKLTNPLALHAFAPVADALQVVYTGLIVTVPIAAVGFVLHFRRSRGIERQQMKWFAAAALLMGIFVAMSPIAFSKHVPPWLWPAMFLVGATSFPVAAGIAILRYRLYDIDRIISRTLAYGLLTAVLGGAFALVVLIPTVVGGLGGVTPGWVVALATLVVVTLFRPLQRRLQSLVDRRFNRRRYDSARTIDDFTVRLRDEIDIGTLVGELEDVVRATMQPSSVSLWIIAQR